MFRSRSDGLLKVWLLLSAVVSTSIVLVIVVFVLRESWGAVTSVGVTRFVSDGSWHPTEQRFGMGPMVVASVATMVGALLLAGPLGVVSALFCQWFAPRPVAVVFRRLVELLAGIPSVVYGFWGLVTLVPLLGRWQPPGASLLAGILIVGLMVLPTVALLSEAAIESVNRDVVKGAAALGFGRWSVLWWVVLPAARPGIVTALLLAAGRAIGETMAVLMVCGNVVRMPASVFDPVRTLTANIALEMAYAMQDHRAVLFVSGAVLMLVVAGLVLTAEVLSHGRLRGRGGVKLA